MSLSSRFLQMAKEEIGEDETKKVQALDQFREWLDKHPFITKSCREDKFLLAFLRTKKYSINQATKSYENFITFCWENPDGLKFSEEKLEKVRDLVKSGYFYFLPERDSLGRRIVILNHGRFDTNKYTADDALAILSLIPNFIAAEEETQIAGCNAIFTYNDVTMKYLGMFSPKSVIDIAKFTLNGTPGRSKNFFFINLPTFGQYLLNAMKLVMSEKIKSRFTLVNEMGEFGNMIDINLFPKEFGGKVPESEIINEFLNYIDDNLDYFRHIYDMEVDETNMLKKNDNYEVVGSFRKLDID